MTTPNALRKPASPRHEFVAGAPVTTTDQARTTYLKKRRFDLGALAQAFAGADESIDHAGKQLQPQA